ncbi:MAG: hypothetical protein KF760_10870 [Candidatus Eremiobacteraeota bacterium]|nr:hypothetical protein [Candidatus Eremiobacteraeota bacterium]MCW5867234.1 hypothetical protein [Candidatus Eremiobacteraeota bacterium]
MTNLAVVLMVLSHWFGWASWRRILETRLRPRMLVGQVACSCAQLCLVAWIALMDGWTGPNDLLANADGGLLAWAGGLLQLAGLWMLCWLTSGLVLGWRREGTRDRKSLAFTLTVALVSHLLLTVVGPLGAVEWIMLER